MNESFIRVAIADDHPLYLDTVERLINNHPPYRVTIKARDGNELLDLLSKSLNPELILLDISMPGMDGFETMSVLKKKMPRVKVLALSGYCNGITISLIRQQGAHGFLSKRAEPDEYIKAFNKVLETGSYYPGYNDLISEKNTTLPALEKLHNLSSKEMTFLQYACTDLNYKQIAEKMNVSRYTIDDYRNALFEKFNIQTRTALILMAVKYKIVEPAGFISSEL